MFMRAEFVEAREGAPSTGSGHLSGSGRGSTALTDVRSLAEGLGPPALDNGGLLPALQQHTELCALPKVPGD